MLTALRVGDIQALELLLDLGVDPDTTFKLGGCLRPALALAVERGYTKLVKALCARYCSTTLGDRDGLTPLHLAAIYGFKEVASILLENRALLNEGTRGQGDTPLHLAASNHQVEMVEFLLERGANVDQANNDGKSPLMYAAAKGDLRSVELLVGAGADVHAQDVAGNTPLLLHTSSAWLNISITRLLCPSPSTTNLCNLDGSYPVLEVVKSTCSARQGALSVLVKAGAQLDVVNSLGSTPLHLACSNSDWISARILVRSGARVDIEDSLGRTGFFIALQNNNLLLAESMVAAGTSCRLPEDQLRVLSSAARQCASRKRLSTLKFSARKVLRRCWGRRTDEELDNVFIPTQLKHYVYYLLE